MIDLEPLRLEPRYAEAIWGGRRLAQLLGKSLPPDRPIGESWEVFGANPVRGGRYAGLTLDELTRRDPPAVVGTNAAPTDDFPLLIKLIDAHLPLSVQVHPDDAFARQQEGGSRGKTEAWYVIAAPERGELIYGLRGGVGLAQIRQSVAAGSLEQLLTRLAVQPGDAVFVPAGTIHAIGGGILLYEVQERSEITYRLYDWGRLGPDGRPRALHLDRALEVVRFPQPPARPTAPLAIRRAGGVLTFLAACQHFALVALDGVIADSTGGTSCAALTVVSGSARLYWSGGSESLALGDSIVLPAGLGAYRLEVTPGGRALRATIPDLDRDVVQPLRRAGYTIEQIAELGEVV